MGGWVFFSIIIHWSPDHKGACIYKDYLPTERTKQKKLKSNDDHQNDDHNGQLLLRKKNEISHHELDICV